MRDRRAIGRSCRRTCRRMRRRRRRRRPRGAAGGRGGGAAAVAEAAARRRRCAAGPAQESMPSCESGYTYPGAEQPSLRLGHVLRRARRDVRRDHRPARSVSPWMHTLDRDPVGLKYRCQWSPPLAIDWFDNSVYFGCQVIFRTRDRGQTWEVDQPGSLDRRSEPHPVLRRRRRRQPRPVLRRGRSPRSRRRARSRACSGPAPTTARCGSRAMPARSGSTSRRT